MEYRQLPKCLNRITLFFNEAQKGLKIIEIECQRKVIVNEAQN